MAGANRLYWPRRGSMQIWPRVRARKIAPRVRHWVKKDAASLLGFVGYKIGMTHVLCRDTNPHSPTKGQNIFTPVTIVACHHITPVSLRFYKKTVDGMKLVGEIFSDKVDKKYLKPGKSTEPQDFDIVKLVVQTHPKALKMGTKTPRLSELGISGSKKEEAVNFGKEILQRDIKISDVFKEGQMIDIHAVSKGKGFQGTVKRFGVKIRHHKSEKTKRGVGSLGPWRPRHVLFTVGQPGKMGFHTRAEYNKQILKIGSKPEEINPQGGFVKYGLVTTEYILLKGSITGARRRPIVLTEPIRPPLTKIHMPEITYVNVNSQQ